jgi:hypothetical protein
VVAKFKGERFEEKKEFYNYKTKYDREREKKEKICSKSASKLLLHKNKNTLHPIPINKYKVTFQIKFRAVTKVLNLLQVPSFFSHESAKNKIK